MNFLSKDQFEQKITKRIIEKTFQKPNIKEQKKKIVDVPLQKRKK